MEITTSPEAENFGVELMAGPSGDGGCELEFLPRERRVRFSKLFGSSGRPAGERAIEAVAGLDQSFQVDVIVRHDIIDAEIGRARSLTTRFWNPSADRLRFFTGSGKVSFNNIRISPLKNTYKPYPVWSRTDQARTDKPERAGNSVQPSGTRQ